MDRSDRALRRQCGDLICPESGNCPHPQLSHFRPDTAAEIGSTARSSPGLTPVRHGRTHPFPLHDGARLRAAHLLANSPDWLKAAPMRENLLASRRQSGQKQDPCPSLLNHNAKYKRLLPPFVISPTVSARLRMGLVATVEPGISAFDTLLQNGAERQAGYERPLSPPRPSCPAAPCCPPSSAPACLPSQPRRPSWLGTTCSAPRTWCSSGPSAAPSIGWASLSSSACCGIPARAWVRVSSRARRCWPSWRNSSA